VKLQKVQVSDLGEIITGNTPPKVNSEYYGTHTIFVKPTDINVNEKYTYTTEESYSDLAYRKYIKSLIPKGSTCVVTIGSIGKKITKAHCDLFINQAMNAVVPNKNYDEDFIFYLLKFNLGKVKTLDSGTASGRENVSKSAFSKINLSVPSLIVQNKIGKLLSNYDDLIENNNKRIKLLENMAEELYKEWFVRLRFPNYQNTKTEDGIPQGWSFNEISNYVTLTDNRGKTPPIENEITDYPLIEVNALGHRVVNYGVIKKFVSQHTVETWFRGSPKKYDTLISTVGSIAELSMFVIEKGNIAQNIVALHGEKISQFYLYQTLKLKKQNILMLNIGGTQPSIKVPHLLSIKILIPNEELQIEFDKIINSLVDEIEFLEQKNQTLKETRDLLLPRLLSGKLDIEKLDIN